MHPSVAVSIKLGFQQESHKLQTYKLFGVQEELFDKRKEFLELQCAFGTLNALHQEKRFDCVSWARLMFFVSMSLWHLSMIQ